jgi:hypothetical protein
MDGVILCLLAVAFLSIAFGATAVQGVRDEKKSAIPTPHG